ncbi:MAG: signal peptidase I [Myxococcaceae bacterium]
MFPGSGEALDGRWTSAWALSLACWLPVVGVTALGSWLGAAFLPAFAVSMALSFGVRLVQAGVPRAEGQRPAWWLIALWLVGTEAVSRLPSLAVRLRLAEPFSQTSVSMEPTLKAGDQLFVFKQGPGAVYGRGSVIAHSRDGLTYVKRVIGLPGDEVTIRGTDVFVNGIALHQGSCATNDEPACVAEAIDGRRWKTLAGERGRIDQTWRLPNDTLFVLGDNRSDSYDSRWTSPVMTEEVVGTAHALHWAASLHRLGLPLDDLP